jgi:hypothetical protein
MNGRDLRKAIDKEFKNIEYIVETRRGRSYELPWLEVYVTATPDYNTYDELSGFVLDWVGKHKRELKVKGRKEYYQVRGMRFPWRDSTYVSITDVEVVLGAFAL